MSQNDGLHENCVSGARYSRSPNGLSIVAVRGGQFVRMDRSGRLLNPPVDWFGNQPPPPGSNADQFFGPYHARVSPDGSRIAYAQSDATGLSCKGCPSTIWVANANGTSPRRLTSETDWFDTSPAWAPRR